MVPHLPDKHTPSVLVHMRCKNIQLNTSKKFRKGSLFVMPKNNSFGKSQLSIKHEI